MSEKPPYRVPSMDEIRALPWNGFTVASTFSGCGGSSLGYRMAGFKVLYANEFVEAARDSYAANAEPHTRIDPRDIRFITADSLMEEARLKGPGELDLLDGSPPCASFSTAGKRHKAWGQTKEYSDTEQRTDDLFFEFSRLVKGVQPKVFVAENVSGLVKGTAKGYFLEILAALKSCGYQVQAKLLDASWLGVPQARQRLIFIGVRNDLGLSPAYPKPLPYQYTVADAIPWVLGITGKTGNGYERVESELDAPMNTIRAKERGCFIVEAPVPGVTFRAVHDSSGERSLGDVTHRPCPTVTANGGGHLFIEAESDMTKYAVGREWDKLGPGGQSEKYFQLVRPRLDKPCPTVTAEGGNAGAASVTHPTERRKFSIAELRRVCAFPDART